MRYRIVKTREGYICQRQLKFLFISYWSNMFCGAWSDLPWNFSSVHDAEEAIIKLQYKNDGVGEVAKEFEL